MTQQWFDDYRAALPALIAGMSPVDRDPYDADARGVANDLAEKRKELDPNEPRALLAGQRGTQSEQQSTRTGRGEARERAADGRRAG